MINLVITKAKHECENGEGCRSWQSGVLTSPPTTDMNEAIQHAS